MTTPSAVCREDRRREDVRKNALLGIDFVEVDATQKKLQVFFLGRAPSNVEIPNVRVTGGSAVAVTWVNVTRQLKGASIDETMDVIFYVTGYF